MNPSLVDYKELKKKYEQHVQSISPMSWQSEDLKLIAEWKIPAIKDKEKYVEALQLYEGNDILNMKDASELISGIKEVLELEQDLSQIIKSKLITIYNEIHQLNYYHLSKSSEMEKKQDYSSSFQIQMNDSLQNNQGQVFDSLRLTHLEKQKSNSQDYVHPHFQVNLYDQNINEMKQSQVETKYYNPSALYSTEIRSEDTNKSRTNIDSSLNNQYNFENIKSYVAKSEIYYQQLDEQNTTHFCQQPDETRDPRVLIGSVHPVQQLNPYTGVVGDDSDDDKGSESNDDRGDSDGDDDDDYDGHNEDPEEGEMEVIDLKKNNVPLGYDENNDDQTISKRTNVQLQQGKDFSKQSKQSEYQTQNTIINDETDQFDQTISGKVSNQLEKTQIVQEKSSPLHETERIMPTSMSKYFVVILEQIKNDVFTLKQEFKMLDVKKQDKFLINITRSENMDYENNYIIYSDTCSKNHAQIRYSIQLDRFFIIDQKSSNGIYFSCNNAKSYDLSNNTLVLLGNTFLKLNNIVFEGNKSVSFDIEGQSGNNSQTQKIKLEIKQSIEIGRGQELFKKDRGFLSNSSISRHHAEIFLSEEIRSDSSSLSKIKLQIKDLGSTYGTWIKIHENEQYPLESEQIIQIGISSRLKIRIQSVNQNENQ